MKQVLKILLKFLLIVLFLLVCFSAYVYFTLPNVKPLITENPETTAFIEYRKKAAEGEERAFRIRWKWIEYAKVPKLLRRTIVVAEDASFWGHKGVDWHELEEAIRDYREEGKKLRGASTISQQLAKNLYLTPERSLLRKLREFLITRDLEKHLEKRRILELYLNYIEFGDGIFGIRSAAAFYFKKHPSQLSLFEMARLAAIIPAPLELHPKKPTAGLRWRTREILKRVNRYGWVSAQVYEEAQAEFAAFFNKK